jgi:hypothetical protein
MVHAENADAIVERDYYPNGALRTDVQRIREMDHFEFDTHRYTLGYGYDNAGRMVRLTHPEELAGSAQADTFAYHPVTGALRWARDRRGHEFVPIRKLSTRCHRA